MLTRHTINNGVRGSLPENRESGLKSTCRDRAAQNHTWNSAQLYFRLFGEISGLGNGFGGFVVTAFASQYSERCGRLILSDTGIKFPEAGQETFRVMAERVRQAGMEAVIDTAVKRLFPQTYIDANPDQVENSQSVLRRIDPLAFVTACETLASLNLERDVKRVKNETLVLVGTLDAATPPAMARLLAGELESAQFIEIPDCGHAPHLQNPDLFLNVVYSFLGPC